MRTKFIRTKYLGASRIQLRYLVLLMVSMVIPMVFVAACMYYLIFTIMAEQLGIPEYVAYNLFPVVRKINLILLIGVPPLFLLLILWGVLLSHRFLGPIERLEKELKKIAEHGNYSSRVRLRKNDDMKPVAEAINKVLDKIEEKNK